MNILITGVTGFVGRSLVDHWGSKGGHALFGSGRDTLKIRNIFPPELFPIGDVTKEVLNNYNIDVVIHLAGIAHDLSNRYVEKDYFSVNLEQTQTVYDEFLRSSASSFIFVSSIKAVVDFTTSLTDEKTAPRPTSPYGISKLRAEQYILANLRSDKRVYILRPVMIHGPNNKGNLNLFYRFVKLRLPLPLGKFHNKRSFLSIDNFNFVLDRIIEGRVPPGVYNVCDSGHISTIELFEICGAAMGIRGRVWAIPQWMIRTLFALIRKSKELRKLTEDMEISNEKILSAVGGRMPVSLENGLKKTILSFRED